MAIGRESDIPILISPDAGRGEARSAVDTVMQTLRDSGRSPIDITGIDAVTSLTAARQAVARGAERLLVVGGDGLVNLGLQAVAATPTILGVIPVGTGNDFVRGVAGFVTGTEASTLQALGDSTEVDAIRTNHGWVASVATAGFSGDVNSRANVLRWPRGPRRYSAATILELPRLAARSLKIVVDGELHETRSVLIAIANTSWFGGGMEICPGADPTDSLLDITLVGDVGRVELMRFFRRVYRGTHLGHPEVSTFRGHEVTIECDGLDLWGDGELLGPAPVTLTAVPRSLRLAGPAT